MIGNYFNEPITKCLLTLILEKKVRKSLFDTSPHGFRSN